MQFTTVVYKYLVLIDKKTVILISGTFTTINLYDTFKFPNVIFQHNVINSCVYFICGSYILLCVCVCRGGGGDNYVRYWGFRMRAGVCRMIRVYTRKAFVELI